MSDTRSRYSLIAIALHWLLALLLLLLFTMGMYMSDLPFSPQRLKLFNWHKWAGLTVMALSGLRLLWRLLMPPPVLPSAVRAAMPTWQQWAHHATHAAMYVLFFAIPLLGWAYSSSTGLSIVVYGLLPLPDFVPVDKALAEILKLAHHYAAYALAALVLLHVAAVIKHQCIDRDGLLARMWPGRR